MKYLTQSNQPQTQKNVSAWFVSRLLYSQQQLIIFVKIVQWYTEKRLMTSQGCVLATFKTEETFNFTRSTEDRVRALIPQKGLIPYEFVSRYKFK